MFNPAIFSFPAVPPHLDFVGQKYESDQAKQAEVKAKIMNGAYFVPWDLQGKSSSH